jgi:hypothetical protein
MRMTQPSLFPVIPQFYAQHHNPEVKPMSEYVDGGRSKALVGSRNIESRLMFGACFVAFLLRAMFTRLMPWRKSAAFDRSGIHESIFKEASSSASVLVTSSFMGL